MQLPIVSKKYVPGGMSGGNVSVSYWYEASGKDGSGKGGVGLFISISGPEDFAGERSAEFMWDSYLEEYLYTTGEVGDVLRKAVKAARERLVALIQHENGVSEQGVDVHICAFAVANGSVSVILMGEPGVVLLRDGKLIDLTDIVPSFSGQGLREEISVGKFALRSRDVIVISSPKLVRSFLDTIGEVSEKTLGDWEKITNEAEQFAQNLVGNQYMWAVGYDVVEQHNETQEGKEVAEGELARVEEKRGEDDKSGVDTEGKTPLQDDDQYTPGGIPPIGEQGGIIGVKNRVLPFIGGLFSRLKVVLKRLPFASKLKALYERMHQPEFILAARRTIGARVSALKLRGVPQRRMVIGQSGTVLSRILKSKVALLIVFLVLLGLMGLYIWRQSEERKRIADIDASLATIGEDIDRAEVDWEAEQDRAATVETLTSLSSSLSGIEDGSLQPKQLETKGDLLGKIQTVYDLMDRVTPIMESNGTVEILTDLYLKIGEGAEVEDFEKYGSDLFLVDKTSHAVYRYSPGQDTVEKVANSSDVLKSPEYIAIGDGYLFVYDSEVGIVMLDMNQNEPEWTFKIRPELSARTIGEIAELAAFMDNVYMLKRDEARVIKSYPAGAGYSFPEEYFRNGGFDKAVDILIDGNIYVFSNSSEKVYKYFGGTQDTFSIEGLTEPLGDLCCGATNVNDTGKLYLFDETNKRIVVLEKPTNERHPGVGVLVKQYVYRGEREDMFTEVKEIVVDIDERVVYVLDGTRLLQVSLDND